MQATIKLLFLSLLFFAACQSSEQVIERKATTINSVGGQSFTQEAITEALSALMDSSGMPGLSFAIISNGQIAYQKNLGVTSLTTKEPVTDSTLFEAASLSKPVFAFFALKQVDKGLLDLDKPLFEYLPFPDLEEDDRYRTITARMILSHTSGLPNWRDGALQLQFDPGTAYSYSGEGYQYLARVIAALNHISTEELSTLFHKEVAKPLGLERLYFNWNDDIAQNKAAGHFDGAPSDLTVQWEAEWEKDRFGAAGGIHTDAENYAKFLTAILEKKGLSAAAYEEFFRQHVALPAEEIDPQLFKASGWSLGLGMIPTNSGMCYYHGGNNGDFQSWFFLHPEKDAGLVYFSNYDKSQTTVFFPGIVRLLDEDIEFNHQLWKIATGN